MGNNPTPPSNPRGRPAGSVNKATGLAREAIAKFVDGNVRQLSGWLEAIANGEKSDDGKWLRLPDPDGAFKALVSVMEFHVPRLARQEIAGDPNAPVFVISAPSTSDNWMRHMQGLDGQAVIVQAEAGGITHDNSSSIQRSGQDVTDIGD